VTPCCVTARSNNRTGAFAWFGDAKKLSSNDNFGKNVAKYSELDQNERFLLHWVGVGTLQADKDLRWSGRKSKDSRKFFRP
jgi:hypothetical protein